MSGGYFMRLKNERHINFRSDKYHLILVANILSSFIVYRFSFLLEAQFEKVMGIASFLTWHNLFEITSVIISFTIFFVCYYTYSQIESKRSIILGLCFLVIGITDLFHTLSYKGMVDFFIPNDTANRATTFWVISGLMTSVGFLVSAFVNKNSKIAINKSFYLLLAILFSILAFIVVTYYPHWLPIMYVEGYGLTRTKVLLEYLMIVMLMVSFIKYVVEYQKSRDVLIIVLANAIILRIFCELAFTLYNSVYDIYNYLGHIYKLAASFIIFNVFFIDNIKKPYLELSKARDELENYAKNLDQLVNIRTNEIKRINQQLLDDLKYARDIQKAMLPGKLPQETEVSFEARYLSAERVSGDFYNIVKLDDEHIALYIGDVSGHGVPAAMLTVFLTQTIRPVEEIDGKIKVIRPSDVLKNVYEEFNKTNFKEEVYIVLFYSIYNIKTHKLMYASGGLNVSPVLIKASGEIREITAEGFPICKFADIYNPEYGEGELILRKGDRVIFYTDGLVEAENELGEKFGEREFMNFLNNNHKQPLYTAAETLVYNVLSFKNYTRLKDDITFFIMQIN